ncbi:AzlD domain-containing protein [Gemmobacter serpentinus]|uniref:AzlD domain-containing protein n=1 Tax=Gemmobacter serpentinus TaxID=2652247 RepID=UPI00124EEED0|nr:AzlD domain-containing protein [Gemmobacter serpentinus]
MIANKTQLWTVILGLGIGTYLLRFSFLGLIGNRALPPMAQRMLRYTPMAVIPGLVAPAIAWPTATGGEADPARLLAALVTVAVGIGSRNTLAAMLAGVVTLAAGLWLQA